MYWYELTYAPLMLGAAFVSIALAVYAWQRQRLPEARPLAFLFLASAIWCVFYGVELAATDLATKLFFVRLEFFGSLSGPAFFLAFAIRYTGRDRWLTRRNLLLLVPEPVLMVLLVFTNEWHRLIYARNELDTSGSWPLLVSSWGPMGWANIAYSYALVAAGLAMILVLIVRRRHGHGRRAVILLLLGLVPVVADVFYVFGRTPVKDLDLTPISFVVVALVFASGITGLRLSDVISVSRREAIENMRDGLVMLDPAFRVIDLNPAAQELTTFSRKSAIGRPVAEVWRGWPDFGDASREEIIDATREMVVSLHPSRTFDVRMSTVFDWRGLVVSRVAVISDVTERTRREDQLLRRYEATRQLADRDPVTGCLNHRAIHERLALEMRKAGSLGQDLCFVMMDLDGFKRVNDRFGHPVGDRVLRHVSRVLVTHARAKDLLGRYGGDEFAAVFPDTSVEGATEVANRWIAALAEHPWRFEDGTPIAVGLSVGISSFPEDAQEVGALVAVADRRLYEAKPRRAEAAVDAASVGATPAPAVEPG